MTRQPNVLEQFLEAEEGAPRMIPWEALLVCLVYLRGGVLHRLRQGGPVQDLRDWDARHGPPTWAKLRAWARELDIEVGIAAAYMRGSGLAHVAVYLPQKRRVCLALAEAR